MLTAGYISSVVQPAVGVGTTCRISQKRLVKPRQKLAKGGTS